MGKYGKDLKSNTVTDLNTNLIVRHPTCNQKDKIYSETLKSDGPTDLILFNKNANFLHTPVITITILNIIISVAILSKRITPQPSGLQHQQYLLYFFKPYSLPLNTILYTDEEIPIYKQH